MPSPSGQKRRLSMRPLLPAAAALLCLLAPAPQSASRAQEQASAPAQRPTPTPEEIGEEDVLKIDTDLILVEVTVTDAAGRAVKGLKPEDFKLYEDGEERSVAFLNVERRGGAERPV